MITHLLSWKWCIVCSACREYAGQIHASGRCSKSVSYGALLPPIGRRASVLVSCCPQLCVRLHFKKGLTKYFMYEDFFNTFFKCINNCNRVVCTDHCDIALYNVVLFFNIRVSYLNCFAAGIIQSTLYCVTGSSLNKGCVNYNFFLNNQVTKWFCSSRQI